MVLRQRQNKNGNGVVEIKTKEEEDNAGRSEHGRAGAPMVPMGLPLRAESPKHECARPSCFVRMIFMGPGNGSS
jgi:hypothetical protein